MPGTQGQCPVGKLLKPCWMDFTPREVGRGNMTGESTMTHNTNDTLKY